VSLCSYLLEFLIYVLWFQRRKWAKARLNKRLVIFGVTSFLLLIAFVIFAYYFNYPWNDVGFTQKAHTYATAHSDKTVFEILNDFGNDEERVFAPWFLGIMRLGGLFLWLFLWASFASFLVGIPYFAKTKTR